MRKKPVLYFLCTGNSCRSQMAEGWARVLGGESIEVYSAGIETHGLNPQAVAVMREAGVDISRHTSKLIDQDLLHRVDYVITLCGDARDTCPVTPPSVTRLHWGFEDPARASGTPDEVHQTFQKVRDGIHRQVRAFLESLAIPLKDDGIAGS